MNLPLSRRHLLLGTSALLVAPAILTGRSRHAKAATTLTLGHGAAPGNPRAIACETFARLVKEKSSGNVTVNIAGSEQLGNDVAMLTSLRTGALDITANSQGAASGLVPEIAALGLPFLFENSGAAFRVVDGGIGQELAKKFEPLGIMTLGWWDNGIRHVTNSKRPIVKPEDVKGLKLRTPADPMTIDIFRALGAGTEQIAFSELYVALQQGVVDGQENPLANIAASKLYEVNPLISLTAHKWESTPFFISRIGWAKLKEDGRDAVKAAAAEAGAQQRQLMQEGETKYLSDFRANPNLKVNDVDRAPFQAATASVIEAWKAKPFGDLVKRLVDAARS